MDLAPMTLAAVTDDLLDYVRKEFLDGDDSHDLTATSPLLEWGILNSMSTVRLVAHVQSTYGVTIAPQRMSAANFRDVQAVARLVQELAEAPALRTAPAPGAGRTGE